MLYWHLAVILAAIVSFSNATVFRDREKINFSAYLGEMPGKSENRKTKYSESSENLGLTVRELMYQDKIAKSFHEDGLYIQEVKNFVGCRKSRKFTE